MKQIHSFLSGLVIGAMLFGGTVAFAASITAEPSTHRFFIDGKETFLTAYRINGNNYVKLRDIGEALNFNVYWSDGVQVDSDAPYTGTAPEPIPPDQSTTASKIEPAREEICEAMIREINEVRARYGKQALSMNRSLMTAAQECSGRLYTYHHNQAECESVARSGYPYGFGSNLTVFTGRSGLDIADRAVENWVNSPGHLETLLDEDARDIGVGVTVDRGRAFCCMFVGKPGTINPYS